MNEEVRLHQRAALATVMSAALLLTPVAAAAMGGGSAIGMRAGSGGGIVGGMVGIAGAVAERILSRETAGREEAGIPWEAATAGGPGDGAEGGDMGDGGVPGDGADGGGASGDGAEPVCTCEKKCGTYDIDRGCRACAADYKLCAYKEPNVVISINRPEGWHRDTATVTFSATDVAHTGNFGIAKVQAKVGQNGGWTDVTEDMGLKISEDCTVYVLVTDQKGNTYERSRAVRCFDTTKPTLNAAVSDGLLSVQVADRDSGARAVYVNGYEFTGLVDGALGIRLQQFDAGYEYFAISAMDNAGNMSEAYRVKNPYYKDPEDKSDGSPAGQLPADASATKPGSATGTVTEHVRTDSLGNAVPQAPGRQEGSQVDGAGQGEGGDAGQPGRGKEFYTIRTASEKAFYLIIDRDGEGETAYFLTEVTENDLLNASSGNSETLPKNAAAPESAIPGGALPNNNGAAWWAGEDAGEPEGAGSAGEPEGTGSAGGPGDAGNAGDAESAEGTAPDRKGAGPSPAVPYAIMAVLAAAVIGGAYYFKVARGKKEDFIEDEDEDMEYGEEYGETDSEDSFLDGEA